jgi:sucrose phosphorylase
VQHDKWVNLLEPTVFEPANPIELQPYQVLWLMPETINNVSPLWAMSTE